jgi:hypothetical protein
MRASALISEAGAKPGPRFLYSYDLGGGAQGPGTQNPLERSKSNSSASNSSARSFKMSTESKPYHSSCDPIPAAKASGTAGRRIMKMPVREFSLLLGISFCNEREYFLSSRPCGMKGISLGAWS